MRHFTWSSFASPIGTVYIASTPRGICNITIPGQTKKDFLFWMERRAEGGSIIERQNKHRGVMDQLNRYFERKLVKFSVRLDFIGTDFQRSVWSELKKVRYGTTVTYAEMSRRLGMPGAAQTIGRANGANPIAVIVPCHRVIGSDDRLVGYAAGVKTKEFLLRLEGALLV